jgi:hypothetical protein
MGFTKVESKKEEIEDTVREVEEETGVNQLRVTKTKTYHILKRNGSTSLKSPIGLKWSLVLKVCPKGPVERG